MTIIRCPQRSGELVKAGPAHRLAARNGQRGSATPAPANVNQQQEHAALPADYPWGQRLFKRLILGGVAVLILQAGLPLQAQAASLLPASQNSVLGKPTVSAAFINRVLVTYHSPAAGKGLALYEDGMKYGIDPVFALAFFLHESTFGTAGVAQRTRSLGNIRCTAGYPTCYAGYRAYPSWEEGFLDWYKLIRTVYVTQWGLTTDHFILLYSFPKGDSLPRLRS